MQIRLIWKVVKHKAVLAGILIGLAGCASNPYEPVSLDSSSFRDRAESQSYEKISVTAAVPGPEETRELFDLPLYDRNIQPIWLKIQNDSDIPIRFAPVGTDSEYFSSQEVAYVHKSGFSKDALREMNLYFFEMSMPRRIPPGETRSGFVFTHASPGTKSFNVDIFASMGDQDHSFTFFIQVPGFEPDHSVAYFQELYPPERIRELSTAELRVAFHDWDRRTTDASGQGHGIPVNVAIVGEPVEVHKALIRAGWIETRRPDGGNSEGAEYLDGRVADVVYIKNERSSGQRNELRIWMSPVLEGKTPVWLVQVVNVMGSTSTAAQIDPDLDDAMMFFLQDLWYGQGVRRFAWSAGDEVATFEDPQATFSGAEYFTSGGLLVMWLSGSTVSMLEVERLEWDPSPFARDMARSSR